MTESLEPISNDIELTTSIEDDAVPAAQEVQEKPVVDANDVGGMTPDQLLGLYGGVEPVEEDRNEERFDEEEADEARDS